MRISIRGGILTVALVLGPSAWAAPPLVANGVTVLETDAVEASLGKVTFAHERTVPGQARLEEGNDLNPRLSILGCSFEVNLQPNSTELERAATVFSRKLTTGRDPPVAGYGTLSSPRPIGIADPLSVIQCNADLTYLFFLYRQTPASGNLIVEAVVIEYDHTGFEAFEAETFDPTINRPSLQVRDVARKAKAIYRMSFRTPEDAVLAAQQDKNRQSALLGLLLRLLSGL